MTQFERKVKKLYGRSWDQIADYWLGHLPIINPPGSRPNTALSDFPGLDSEIFETPVNGEARGEVPNFRKLVFHEAVFILHKVGHILRASEDHANSGLQSWSLASAYQSSFFALKSILAFLGIVFPHDRNNKTIMVDIWAVPNRKGRVGYARNDLEMQFVRHNRLEHKEMWTLFLRALRVTECKLWNKSIVDALIAFEPTMFARQRNLLHYNNHKWIFYADLFTKNRDTRFDELVDSDKLSSYLTSSTDVYTMAVAFALYDMAVRLFEDVANSAPLLSNEFGQITSTLSQIDHPYFHRVNFA